MLYVLLLILFGWGYYQFCKRIDSFVYRLLFLVVLVVMYFVVSGSILVARSDRMGGVEDWVNTAIEENKK